MKAKKIAEILFKNPEANVTLSVSNDKLQIFADNIIEITQQGEKQLTIVSDINENYLLHIVSKQRELLIAFSDYLRDEKNTQFIPSRFVDEFLKSNL